MKKVCVITGGGSGMCLSAAKFLDKDMQIVITGRTLAKLDAAKSQLEALGFCVETLACDVSKRGEVQELVKVATSLGEVVAVINGAGVSPTMGNAEYIFGINALGTVAVNEEFSAVMSKGGCIVDIASIAGYMLPEGSYPVQLYPLALQDPNELAAAMQGVFAQVPEKDVQFFSYAVSKNFVAWYAKQLALTLGKQGIRVLSVSPGVIDTPMVQAESESTASEAASEAGIGSVLDRMGSPDELGSLLAFLATGPATYITATDILCDGGFVASMKAAQEQSA